MTLKEKFGSKSDCWEEKSEPVFRVWIDGQCLGFPFFSLLATCYTPDDKLRLDFPIGTVVISGPKAWHFYAEFSGNHATNLRADAKDIVSVELELRDHGDENGQH